MIMFHLRKNSFYTTKTSNRGHENRLPGKKRLRKWWKSPPSPGEPLLSLGPSKSSPEGRSPLAEYGVGARFFADNTLCYHVGRAWRGLAATGGHVALGIAVPSRAMLKPG